MATTVKLPKEIWRLQKRARDKDSRFRTKGARESEIKTFSPLLPAERVAQMDPGTLQHYAQKLREYTSRTRGYTVLASGDMVKTQDIINLRHQVKKQNKQARKLRREIDDNMAKLSPEFQKAHPTQAQRTILRGGGIRHGDEPVGAMTESGRFRDWTMTEKPASRAAMRERERTLSRVTSQGWQEEAREAQRKGAMKMLLMMGAKDVQQQVKHMTNAQFDVLAAGTDFFELLTVDYAPDVIADYSDKKDMSVSDLENEYALQAYTGDQARFVAIMDRVNEVMREV